MQKFIGSKYIVWDLEMYDEVGALYNVTNYSNIYAIRLSFEWTVLNPKKEEFKNC